ncbi:MAG: TetR/AcrR family transcriptional regulator [Myxococcota bacterium]
MARKKSLEASGNGPDGRALRGARNRERIVEALLELVREGELLPTAEQVSQRAGVGTRTVFRHFDDMESLNSEVQAAIKLEIDPLLTEPRSTGNLEQRTRAMIRRRIAIFERIAPFMRSGDIQRWNTPFLQRNHAEDTRRLRADLLKWLPELVDADDDRLEALDLFTSFEAWNRLRVDQRLGRDRTQEVIEAAALAILGK